MKKDWKIEAISALGKVYNGNSINENYKKENYLNIERGFPFIATKDVGFGSIINYENGVKIPFDERNNFKISDLEKCTVVLQKIKMRLINSEKNGVDKQKN